MTPENKVNNVFLSKYLRANYPSLCAQIIEKLRLHKINVSVLENTLDYWLRDFMPIQINKNTFVHYVYAPDYLKNETEYQTNAKDVWKNLSFTKEKTLKETKLILDGGNVVKSKNCIILTDKILQENKLDIHAIRKKLHKLFEVEKVVIVPWDKRDKYGHTDGMLRFINEDTVLLNGYFRSKYYSRSFQNDLYGALEKNKLNVIELTFEEDINYSLNWAYINFLQTQNLILLPKFNIIEDQQALEQMQKHFPNTAIEQIEMKSFVKKGGGALNCLSWSIAQ